MTWISPKTKTDLPEELASLPALLTAAVLPLLFRPVPFAPYPITMTSELCTDEELRCLWV